jgi:uncharacterized cofD-like protein
VAHALRWHGPMMNIAPALEPAGRTLFPVPPPLDTPQAETTREASPRIVAIGGGTGLPAVLEGLSAYAPGGAPNTDAVTAIVTVTDDGGSSGRLRREFGVLPPGDIRNCLVALSDANSPFRQLLQHRFNSAGAAKAAVDGDAHGIEGHAVGNLLLTALAQITGDFPEAVHRLSEMIGLRGRVLPTTAENVRLRAEMESGQIVTGETAIVEGRRGIRQLSLDPSPRPLPDVLRALVNADGIVVGPGSLYTSILPNLLVEGIASTLYGVNAVRIYVANLMTEPGETDHYTLDDHLRAIRMHTGFDLFDYVLVNRHSLEPGALEAYASQGAEPVASFGPLGWAGRAQIVECRLEIEYSGRKIRHQPASLGRALRALVHAGRGHSILSVPGDCHD